LSLLSLPPLHPSASATHSCFKQSCFLSIVENAAASAPLFVVFDEFQDIRKLPSADQAIALLRARIQLLADTAFVFSGSVRSDIADLFANPTSPFFKSARTLSVGPVPDDDFAPFLARRFALGRRTAPRPLLDDVFDFTHRIPGDVQQLCAALWNVSGPGDILTPAHLKAALREIYEQESGVFELQTSRLTRYQFKTLVAVANTGGQNVYSADFLARAELPTAAAATRAFQALVRDGILYLADKEYRFFNPFLRAWLLEKTGNPMTSVFSQTSPIRPLPPSGDAASCRVSLPSLFSLSSFQSYPSR